MEAQQRHPNQGSKHKSATPGDQAHKYSKGTTSHPSESPEQTRTVDPQNQRNLTTQYNLEAATRERRKNRQGRQRRQRKNKHKHKTQAKNRQYQTHIPQYMKTTPTPDDHGAGHEITSTRNNNEIRIILQNPNGVKKKDSYFIEQQALRKMRDWGVDIIALPETNKNWNTPWIRQQWIKQVKTVWRHAKVYNSSIVSASTKDTHVQGGVSLIVTNKWSSRVISHGEDPLGRWAWIKLRGKQNQTLTCMTMYRPNPGQDDKNLTSVWSQQY